MTIPKITPYTGGVANPDGSQTQTEFTQNMFDQLSYEANLSTELNDTVDGINDTATKVDADAISASQSANAAEAAASVLDYKGLWPDTGGSANKGETWQTQTGGTHTGQYFTALQSTTVDPVSDDVNWREVVSGGSFSKYTDIVYKASGGNSAVDNMIAGVPIDSSIGDKLSTGYTIWERTSKSFPSVIGDFTPLKNASVVDFGAYIPTKSLAGALEDIHAIGMVAEIPSVRWADRFTLDRKVDVGSDFVFKISGLGVRPEGILGNTEDEKYSYVQILAGGGFTGGVGPNDRRSINCNNVTFVGPNSSPTNWRTSVKQETVFEGTFGMKLTSNAFIGIEYGENNDYAYFNEYRFNLFGNCTYPLMLDDTNSTTWSGNFFAACVHGIVGAPVSESCYLEDNKFNITNETISCINIGGGVEFGGSTYLENFATVVNPKGLVPIVYRPASGDRWAKIGNIYANVGASAPMVNIVLLTTSAASMRTRIEINNIYKSGNTSGKAIQFGANTFDDSGLDPRLLRNGNGALQLVDLDLASTNLLPSDVGNFYISDKPITKGLIQNGATGRLELQAGNVIDKGAQFQTYSDRLDVFRTGEFVLKLNLVLSSSAGGTLRVRPTVSGSVIETVLQDVYASGSQTLSYELPAVFTAGQTIYFDTAVTSGDVTIESGSYSFEFIDEGLKSDPF